MTTHESSALCADNDNVRYRGGMRAVHWLAKKDPAAALAVLQEIRDATCQTRTEALPGYLRPLEHNPDDSVHAVPDEEVTSETMAEPAQDGPDEIWPEALHEIRPSERDICRALGWIEWPFTGRSSPMGWCMRLPHRMMWPTEGGHMRPSYDGTRAYLAGMVFATGKGAGKQRDGLMISFSDANGLEQRPSYRTSKPRGGKRPHRTTAAIDAYLALPAVTPSPMHAQPYQRPISDAPALMPMLTPQLRKAPDAWDKFGRYGVAEARAEIARLMPSAPPITVCPVAAASRVTVNDTDERIAHFRVGGVGGVILPRKQTLAPIARGARFIAGISGTKQTASVPAPSWQMPEAKPLSPVLDEVAARGTLESIGRRLGFNGGYADRAGGKALLAEGKALVAANDSAKRKIAA